MARSEARRRPILYWACRQLARVGIEPQMLNPQMVEKLSEFGDPKRARFVSTLQLWSMSGNGDGARQALPPWEDLPVLLIWGFEIRSFRCTTASAPPRSFELLNSLCFHGSDTNPRRDPDRFAQLLRDFAPRRYVPDSVAAHSEAIVRLTS